jgi:hypothetical protein
LIDSAESDYLGAESSLLIPGVTASFYLRGQDAIIGAALAHSFDIEGDEDISETEIRPFYLRHLGYGSWYEIIAHLYVDRENDNEFGWFQEARICQMLNDRIGVTTDLGLKITGDNRLVHDYSLGMSARYLF